MIAYELLGERSSYELLILSKSFEFWSQNYVKIILFFWFKISATIDFIIYLQFSGRVRLANQLYSNEVMKFESKDYFIQLCYSHLVGGENQVIQLKSSTNYDLFQARRLVWDVPCGHLSNFLHMVNFMHFH